MTQKLEKEFLTYEQQVELLVSRGMRVDDIESCMRSLSILNYYRLSGYWFPLFDQKTNRFKSNVQFLDILNLYNFDNRLKIWLFSNLSKIEIGIRGLLGYELGRIDRYIHLNVEKLGARARTIEKTTKQNPRDSDNTNYDIWHCRYKKAVRSSREAFVEHHIKVYDGKLPIWVAVEIMDWGLLSNLYGICPENARAAIADRLDLTSPQLESWLKSLNIVRNFVAHHARVYNRVFDLKPKFPKDDKWSVVRQKSNKFFAVVVMIYYLMNKLRLSDLDSLDCVFNKFPDIAKQVVKFMGFPENWRELLANFR